MANEYRYTLRRLLDADNPRRLCWVMLNPSTADETLDDPTIRRVRSFTAAHGFGRLVVVNLFGLRATNPARLLEHPDPVGPANADAIERALLTSHDVVFAWGAWSPKAARDVVDRQARRLDAVVRDLCHRPHCLGTTKAGAPRHPLYVAGAQRLVPYGRSETAS